MQTKELFYEDIELTKFEANIISIEKIKNEYHIVLDQTAFYPDGGGMAADKGTLDNIKLINVIKKDGVIYHITKEKPQSDTVVGIVDAHNRIKQIQTHDAQHLLSALFEKNYNLHTTSHHVGDNYCDLYLDNGDLTQEMIDETEKIANQLIYEQKKLDIFLLAKADLASYNIEDNPKYSDPVRITNIETVNDYNACGCLHFDNLARIQAIKCFKFEKVSGQNRIIFSAGKNLIDYIDYISNNYDHGKTLLKANDDNFINMIDTLHTKSRNTAKELEDIKHDYYSLIIDNLANESNFITYQLNEDKSQDIKVVANQIINHDKNIYGLIQVKRNDKFQFTLAKQKNSDYDIDNIFSKLKQSININGGGKGLSITGQSDTNLIEIIEDYL